MRTTLFLAPLFLFAAATAAPAMDAPLDAGYLRLHAETRGFMLGRPVKPKPTPGGKFVLFLRSEPKSPQQSLYEFDTATGKTRELLTPEQLLKGVEENLSPEEKARRERQRVSVGGFTDFQLSPDGEQILVTLSGKPYIEERKTGEAEPLRSGDGPIVDPKFSPNGVTVAYVRGHDIYLSDGLEFAVTTGGTEKRTNGLAEFVAQEEMHRFTGYWWAPDSKSIAFEEADAEGVDVWQVADPIHPDQPAQPFFYPRPGKANVKVRLGIIEVPRSVLSIRAKHPPTTWVAWDDEQYPYLADVKWDKDDPMTLLVQNRTQTEQVLLHVDPATGKTTPLLTETDAAWVNLRHDGPRWLDDGSFLWPAEGKDGPRLEWREKDGSLRRVLVPADAGFQELVDADPNAGQIVYRASPDPSDSMLFRLKLDGGKPTPLDRAPGQHSAVFSKGHSIYVETTTTAAAMPKTTVHQVDGELIGELPSVALDPPFPLNTETLQVGEDPGFYAYVVRPHDFDKTKRYPVILHVYGGPTHLMVSDAMGGRLLDQWLADQGFIVAAVDNRGTPGRGRDWEKAVSKHFGSVPLEDQIAGLKALGRRFPEMDLDRVGVYGWSFGGYLSALAVLKAPDVFKAAVAGAPVVDWLDYDTHYTERYLGLPDTDAEAYKEASLLTYAADLKRPLLLVHGTADDNVYFRHTLKLTNALFRAGKDFELLPLAGMTHMTPDPVVTERLYERIAGHFRKNLGKPEQARKGP
ncbi:MAG TPA: alpha/beta fold hydrolase [Gemmataceae bacterium]|nr:alpha/beta fold hydrolase [Gemmataceae bacterium]